MFWIKFLIFLAVVLIVLVLGTEIFYVNTHPVQFNYVLGSVDWPLSFVILGMFTAGVLLTFLISLLIILPLRWRVNRLRRTVDLRDREIGALLKKSAQGVLR